MCTRVRGGPASLPRAVPERASPGREAVALPGSSGVLRCQGQCGPRHVTASLWSFTILKAEGLAIRPLLSVTTVNYLLREQF